MTDSVATNTNTEQPVVRNSINGFSFDAWRQIIAEPENPSLDLLISTRDELYAQNEFICAARIMQRINVLTNYGVSNTLH